MSAETKELALNWQVKQADLESEDAWLPVERVPAEIHPVLQKNGKIANPYNDLNELSVRSVGEKSWIYRTTFSTPKDADQAGVATDLVFKGLDTFATVTLNGVEILKPDNMFTEYRIQVDDHVTQVKGASNSLEILFEPAREKGLELVKQHPEHRFIVHQTEVSRAPVRKAQYHWGWDWGPILLTCGPWKPILLEIYQTRIEDFWVEYELSEDLSYVRITANAEVEGEAASQVAFSLRGDQGQNSEHKAISFGPGQKAGSVCWRADWEIKEPGLWWPFTIEDFKSHRYSFIVKAIDSKGHVLVEKEKLVGFRRVELVQEPDDIGRSFYFRINNVDVFAGGSCWLPTDNFLSQVSTERYRDWMKLIRDGNQNMIRVWGGGIYEADALYDACDELGILVWQDFQFACASYPTYPEFLQSIDTEARQNIRRLRHHPALVLWCGNNEDYQLVERYGLNENRDNRDPESWLKSEFPARYIYEHILPNMIKDLSGHTPYHPSSPFGNGHSTVVKVDPTIGDIHQWNLWHGTQNLPQKLPSMGGRFISEFGMCAYPHSQTLSSCITDPSQRYPGSMTMDFHNKAIGHERRMILYVAEQYSIKYDLENFIHLTQMVQADCITWAYRAWRRQWGSSDENDKRQRQCGGALVWQTNDCWPTISWAIVDYNLIPKPAYFALKRTMSPLTINVVRKFHDWTQRPADELWIRDTGHVDPRKALGVVEYDVWISSSLLQEKTELKMDVRFISIATGEDIQPETTKMVTAKPNTTTNILTNATISASIPPNYDPNTPLNTSTLTPFIIQVTLTNTQTNDIISTDTSWPDPIKYLTFPDRDVHIEYSQDDNSAIVTAAKPIKGFTFDMMKGLRLSDNGFDIVPGEGKKVEIMEMGRGKWKGGLRWLVKSSQTNLLPSISPPK